MDLFSTYDSVDTVPGVDEMYIVTHSTVPTGTVREIPDVLLQFQYEKGKQQAKVRRELQKLRTTYNPTVSPVPSKKVDLPSAPDHALELARDRQYIVTGNIALLRIDMDTATDSPWILTKMLVNWLLRILYWNVHTILR